MLIYIMYIIFLLFLFIKNDNKKYYKNMVNIYTLETIPYTYSTNNIDNIYINNENITNNYIITNNKKGFDNRNITEENNLEKIIGYNKIILMLDFLLSNKSNELKISFIEKNNIIKKKNFLNELFEEFKNNNF